MMTLFGTNYLDNWDASTPLQFSEFGVFQESALRAMPPSPVPPIVLLVDTDDNEGDRFFVHRWERHTHLPLLDDPMLMVTWERHSIAFCREVGCMHYDLPVHELLLCRSDTVDLLRNRTLSVADKVRRTVLSLDYWECLYLNDTEHIPYDVRREHDAFFEKHGGDVERFWRAVRFSHG